MSADAHKRLVLDYLAASAAGRTDDATPATG